MDDNNEYSLASAELLACVREARLCLKKRSLRTADRVNVETLIESALDFHSDPPPTNLAELTEYTEYVGDIIDLLHEFIDGDTTEQKCPVAAPHVIQNNCYISAIAALKKAGSALETFLDSTTMTAEVRTSAKEMVTRALDWENPTAPTSKQLAEHISAASALTTKINAILAMRAYVPGSQKKYSNTAAFTRQFTPEEAQILRTNLNKYGYDYDA